MQRIRFIDRMASGKISRRTMLGQASAFGVGLLALPRLTGAAEVLTCLEWAGYDSPDYFKSYVGKYGGAPNFSIFTGERIDQARPAITEASKHALYPATSHSHGV